MKIKYTYSNVDQLFYISLYDNKGNKIESRHFKNRKAANQFYNRVRGI